MKLFLCWVVLLVSVGCLTVNTGPTPAAPTSVPAPTNTPSPTLTRAPTPTVTPTPTTMPAPTATPALTVPPTLAPTATPAPTTAPAPTGAPLHAEDLAPLVQRVRPAVVRVQQAGSVGSGVIFKTEGQEAYVLTNNHVVDNPRASTTVIVNDQTSYAATTLGQDNRPI